MTGTDEINLTFWHDRVIRNLSHEHTKRLYELLGRVASIDGPYAPNEHPVSVPMLCADIRLAKELLG